MVLPKFSDDPVRALIEEELYEQEWRLRKISELQKSGHLSEEEFLHMHDITSKRVLKLLQELQKPTG